MVFAVEQLEAARVPLVHMHLGADGLPTGATAAAIIRASPEAVWALVNDVAAFSARVPMMDGARLQHGLWHMDLRFRVALLSVRFGFVAQESKEPLRMHQLRAVSGEPRDLLIRYELTPCTNGTAVHVTVGFDILSLGWLVKVFLRHHPEIRFGTMAGCPLTLLDTLARALGSPHGAGS